LVLFRGASYSSHACPFLGYLFIGVQYESDWAEFLRWQSFKTAKKGCAENYEQYYEDGMDISPQEKKKKE